MLKAGSRDDGGNARGGYEPAGRSRRYTSSASGVSINRSGRRARPSPPRPAPGSSRRRRRSPAGEVGEALLRSQPVLDRHDRLGHVGQSVAPVDDLVERPEEAVHRRVDHLVDARLVAPADGAVVRTLRKAGPPRRGPLDLVAQVVPVRRRRLRDVGNWWATAIAVMSFRCCALPELSEPTGLVVVLAPNGVAPERWIPVFMYASLS